MLIGKYLPVALRSVRLWPISALGEQAEIGQKRPVMGQFSSSSQSVSRDRAPCNALAHSRLLSVISGISQDCRRLRNERHPDAGIAARPWPRLSQGQG